MKFVVSRHGFIKYGLMFPLTFHLNVLKGFLLFRSLGLLLEGLEQHELVADAHRVELGDCFDGTFEVGKV